MDSNVPNFLSERECNPLRLIIVRDILGGKRGAVFVLQLRSMNLELERVEYNLGPFICAIFDIDINCDRALIGKIPAELQVVEGEVIMDGN